MATYDCLPVCFDGICNNAFYFRGPEEDEDVDEDGFQMSESYKCCWIKNDDSKFLILDRDQFEAIRLNKARKKEPECQFRIHTYNFVPKTTGDKREYEGTTVMLYTEKDGVKMVACCKENEVHPVKMNLPHTIDEDHHKAVFFLKQIPSESEKFMFESSTNKEKFLAFEADESNPSIVKLVLRYKADEVDNHCVMTVEDISP